MWSKTTDGKSFMVCGVTPKDAEYRQVGEKQSSFTTFSVKSDEIATDNGETQAKWTNCKCWHSVARYAATIKKGDMVFAVGKIETDTWTDKKTGEQKTSKNLVCDFVAILPQTQAPQQSAGFVPADKNANVTVPAPADDDYPF